MSGRDRLVAISPLNANDYLGGWHDADQRLCRIARLTSQAIYHENDRCDHSTDQA
jgi:hypothetical protein